MMQVRKCHIYYTLSGTYIFSPYLTSRRSMIIADENYSPFDNQVCAHCSARKIDGYTVSGRFAF